MIVKNHDNLEIVHWKATLFTLCKVSKEYEVNMLENVYVDAYSKF